MRRSALQVGSVFGSAAAALTATAASICCIGPLGLALLGVNGAILAAGLKPYRAYFLVASLVFIGLAFWAVYGGRKKSNDSARCSVRSGRIARLTLWVAAALWLGAVIVQFVADRYWL